MDSDVSDVSYSALQWKETNSGTTPPTAGEKTSRYVRIHLIPTLIILFKLLRVL